MDLQLDPELDSDEDSDMYSDDDGPEDDQGEAEDGDIEVDGDDEEYGEDGQPRKRRSVGGSGQGSRKRRRIESVGSIQLSLFFASLQYSSDHTGYRVSREKLTRLGWRNTT